MGELETIKRFRIVETVTDIGDAAEPISIFSKDGKRITGKIEWRRSLGTSGLSPGAAAAIGKYISNNPAPGPISATPNVMVEPAVDEATEYRWYGYVYSAHGTVDPTTSGYKVSLYECTGVTPTTTGVTYVLGLEVAASVVTPAITPRGNWVKVDRTFTLDPTKTYVSVQEILTAPLPTNVTIRSGLNLMCR